MAASIADCALIFFGKAISSRGGCEPKSQSQRRSHCGQEGLQLNGAAGAEMHSQGVQSLSNQEFELIFLVEQQL